MPENNPNISIQRFSKGDKVTASRLNESIDAINTIARGVGLPSQLVRSSGGGGTQIKMFLLALIQDDYLICNEWDGTTAGTAQFNIARPDSLRVIGWDG